MATVAQVLNPLNHDGWYSLGGMPIDGSTSYGGTLNVQFRRRLRGGKGGFAVLLKQQGERMAKKANESENTDRFRTLSGQRAGTVRQAQEIARQRDTLASEEAHKRRKRKEKLERALKPKPKAVAEPRAKVEFKVPLKVKAKAKPKKAAEIDFF